MSSPNPLRHMRRLSPGLFACRHQATIRRRLKAAGLHGVMSKSIRVQPGGDFLMVHQDEQGAHAFIRHGNPDDPGFTYYLAQNPTLLLPLLVHFAGRSSLVGNDRG